MFFRPFPAKIGHCSVESGSRPRVISSLEQGRFIFTVIEPTILSVLGEIIASLGADSFGGDGGSGFLLPVFMRTSSAGMADCASSR